MQPLKKHGWKTPLNEKAQVFTSDMVIATTLFLVITGLFIYVWFDLISGITRIETGHEAAWLATATSEKLVRTAGEPYNWTSDPGLSNITVIGLAGTQTRMNSTWALDRVLDAGKVLYLINHTNNNYSAMRSRMFGLGKYGFYIELSCLDDRVIDCFQGLETSTIETANITCSNNMSFQVHNRTMWADPSLSGSWHFDEGRAGSAKDGSGNDQTGTIHGALKAVFAMGASANSYVYEDLTSVPDYTIQAGDKLEYDVYWTLPDDGIAVDYTLSNGSALRNSGATDQNGMPSHPAADLAAYALNRWYHRTIALPPGHAGKVITFFDIACESDEDEIKTAYLDDIVITDASGTVRRVVYRGGAFNNSLHFQEGGILASLEDSASPTAWNSSGTFTGYLELDGVDDYMGVSGTDALSLGANQSMSLWVKVAAGTGEYVRIAGRGNDTHRSFGLWREPDGDILYQIYGPSGECNFTDPGHSINIAAGSGWTYLAVTYNGTAAKMYLNGSEAYSGNCVTTPYASSEPLTVGYGGMYGFLDGAIDEIKLWNRTLPGEEIKKDFDLARVFCLIGRNASISEADYVNHDIKTFTFKRAGNETWQDPQTSLLEPTAKIKLVLYTSPEEA